jgi:hypothetical protein
MNRFAILALYSPLLAAAGCMAPQPEPRLVGGYQAAALDAPLVLEAQAFIQKHFAFLRLEAIQEAYTQVVAGTNVKLVCRVAGEGEPSQWEFVAWRKLNGTWELQSARRV